MVLPSSWKTSRVCPAVSLPSIKGGSEQFHRFIYLGLQRFRGRPVGAYIRKLQEWERLDPAAFQQLRTARLFNTLDYARERVPLYRSESWRRAGRDLSTWPVLERDIIQGDVQALLAQPTPSGHFFRYTSGSTGAPLGVGMDPSAAAWAWASDLRGLLWHGIGVGARGLALRAKPESPLVEWVRNHKAIRAADLSRPRLLEAVKYLERKRPTFVWGYASAIAELARLTRETIPDTARPLALYAKVFGEMLYPFQRQEIEEGLGARVVETYGCNETGTVGYECPAGSLHVFSEHVEVEILNQGEPAYPGELGDIVLTCTTNRVMPLIRYRVGDRGRLSPEPCLCGRPHPVLYDIQGRVGDVLLTATGELVHGTPALGAILKMIHAKASQPAIRQAFFEQHDPRRWTVLVVPGPSFSDKITLDLVESVRGVFGEECEVRIKPVSEIPREPSGKFRFYRVAPRASSQS